jgi:hypothetical protein
MFPLAWKRSLHAFWEMFAIFVSAKSAVQRVEFALENRRARGSGQAVGRGRSGSTNKLYLERTPIVSESLADGRLHGSYFETTFEEHATQAAFADTEYQSRFSAIR